MEAVRETLLVAGHDLKHSLRSTKALVFLLLYAVMTLLVGGGVVWATGRVMEEVDRLGLTRGMDPAELAEEKAKAYRQLVSQFVDDEEAVEHYASIPVVVLFFFWATRVFLPLLIGLMSYDQINGELHNRSIRYTLLRARRGALLAGKLTSNMTLILGLTVATNLLLLGFAVLRIPDFDLGGAVWHVVRFWLLTLPLAAAWLAVSSFLSTLFRSPYYSLLAMLGVLFLSLALWLLSLAWDAIEPAKWLFPWQYGGFLASPKPAEVLLGVGGFLGFACVFTLLSFVVFYRRDV